MNSTRTPSTPARSPGVVRHGLPEGFVVELDPDCHVSRNGRLVFGGSPQRLLRLSETAAGLLGDGSFVVRDGSTARLARVLLDAGVVHPRPPEADAVDDVSIVVPVRDRPAMVDRLLGALRADPHGNQVPIVVVDDGSSDPGALRAVAHAHSATVLRHEHSRGPAAARNTGIRAVRTSLVAFCDSDVVPDPGWLAELSRHFADRTVGLAAPRIVALSTSDNGLLDRFDRESSPLDLGTSEAPIVPMSRVAYVPSAAVMMRASALLGGFDETMPVAEDVDLCLRLYETGWRMRYVADVHVAHEHRTDPARWLWQRGHYGTGAALLSRRHPGRVPPVSVAPWSVLACLAAASGRRGGAALAVALTTGSAVRLARKMPDADHPWSASAWLSLAALRATAQQLTRAATRHHWPVAVLLAVFSPRARRIVLTCSLLDALLERREKRSELGAVSYVAARRLDDLAYGAGVWWGALRSRTLAPLVPRISARMPKGPTGPRA